MVRYRLLSDFHIEDLLKEVNELAKDGWRIVGTIQEHAFTKLILELDPDPDNK